MACSQSRRWSGRAQSPRHCVQGQCANHKLTAAIGWWLQQRPTAHWLLICGAPAEHVCALHVAACSLARPNNPSHAGRRSSVLQALTHSALSLSNQATGQLCNDISTTHSLIQHALSKHQVVQQWRDVHVCQDRQRCHRVDAADGRTCTH